MLPPFFPTFPGWEQNKEPICMHWWDPLEKVPFLFGPGKESLKSILSTCLLLPSGVSQIYQLLSPSFPPSTASFTSSSLLEKDLNILFPINFSFQGFNELGNCSQKAGLSKHFIVVISPNYARRESAMYESTFMN